LQQRFEELRAQGIGVAAISYDPRDVLARFAQRRDITDVPLLSDNDSSTIRAFGIYNYVAEHGFGSDVGDPALEAEYARYVSVLGPQKKVIGTPFPGSFMVDREGRVTARFFEEFYRERNTVANIMLRQAKPLAGVAGDSTETAHLRIAPSQSDREVATGSRFHVALDITPKAGMHVYAPGAEELGYQVIRLELETQDSLRVLPVDYRPSEIHHFAALNERIPAYKRPFRLVQELVVNASEQDVERISQLDALHLRGRLDYQACNDRVCFDPASVPLAWTVGLTPLDRQRAR